jgi:hypothetical protein
MAEKRRKKLGVKKQEVHVESEVGSVITVV